MAACELETALEIVADVVDKGLGVAIPAVAGTNGMGGGGLGLHAQVLRISCASFALNAYGALRTVLHRYRAQMHQQQPR